MPAIYTSKVSKALKLFYSGLSKCCCLEALEENWKFRVWKSKKYENGFKSNKLTVRLPLAIREKEVLKNK